MEITSRTQTNPWQRILLFLLFLYISTSIFYIFPSGNPQPSDLLMLCIIGMTGISFLLNRSKKISRAALWAGGFGAYTLLINLLFFYFLKDTGFLKSSAYYIYNAGLMIFVMSLLKNDAQHTARAAYCGVTCAILLQLLYVVFFPMYESGRLIGSFNNPNQLAQWSLLSACMIITLRYPHKMNLMDLGLILITVYIQVLALSKAGLVCTGLLLLSLGFSNVTVLKHKIVLVFCVFCALTYAAFLSNTVFNDFQNMTLVENSINRVKDIGHEADDNPRRRGYYRLIEYPQYLLTGAGEGAYARFSDLPKPLEIHSGLANILFSYGVIGFAIFLGMLWSIYKNQPVYPWVLLAIIMLNGLTHQNIRFSHFWLFLGMVQGVRYLRLSRNRFRD